MKDNLTLNYNLIVEIIPSSSKVLDLGCGSGTLLKELSKKNIYGTGVEIDENMVIECLKKGISVIQENIDKGLTEYPDHSYDYVILNQTLQSVYNTEMLLNEMLRVGKKAIVGIPNFANWAIRKTLFFNGRMPVTKELHFEWYNTPNIRLTTIKDFLDISHKLNIKILNSYYSTQKKLLNPIKKLFPNFFAENALFILTKENNHG